jgi:hypothetical protein
MDKSSKGRGAEGRYKRPNFPMEFKAAARRAIVRAWRFCGVDRSSEQPSSNACKFGRESEKLDRQLKRLEARLEDLVAEEGVTR